MKRLRRRRGTKALIAFGTVFAISAFVPAVALAQGNAVNDLLKGILGGGGGGPQPAAGAPPSYTPPLHGANPHGQGDVATVDLLPSNTAPLPGDPSAGDEDIVIGSSRGEESNGSYQGRVTLLHVNLLGLINQPIVEIKTTEGQTANGPLAPLQTAIDQVCGALTQPAQCVELLPMNSSSSATGSQNSFGVLKTDLGFGGFALDTGVATTEGNISDNGTCQTASGSSNVASATAGPISADALQGGSTSQACNDGSQSQSNNSTVVNLQGTGVPLPAAGCANGTPDTNFTALMPLVGLVCNADDSNGGQTANPYGVREALTVFALVAGGTPLVKATTAGPESHAVAPPGGTTPGTPTAPGDDGAGGVRGEQGGPGDDDAGGGPGGPASSTAQSGGGGELAFTGANLLVLALIGGALMAGGLMLARASRRHSRAAA
jgi:hypothetical protein